MRLQHVRDYDEDTLASSSACCCWAGPSLPCHVVLKSNLTLRAEAVRSKAANRRLWLKKSEILAWTVVPGSLVKQLPGAGALQMAQACASAKQYRSGIFPALPPLLPAKLG